MKRIFAILLIGIFLISCLNISAFADNEAFPDTVAPLRAGGGGSGGGGGGGSSGGSSGGTRGYRGSRYYNPFSWVIHIIMLPFALGGSIVFALRLSKRARKSKKLMKEIAKSDNAWKFKDIEAYVKEGFYKIQVAWSEGDMLPAREYMSKELYDSFQTKLRWMRLRSEQNVIRDIKLIDALPVSVQDSSDNSMDHIWFYIKAKMIDYTINTETNAKVEGSTAPTKFVEYWQFVREDDCWVLNKILQEDESDRIAFTE